MRSTLTGFPLTLAALALAGSASAADFSYNRLQVGVGEIDPDHPGGDGEGLLLDASASVAPNVFLTGGYHAWDLDGPVDRDDLYVGIGAHGELNRAVDLVGQLTYENREIDAGRFGRDHDEDGIGGRLGVRALAADRLELAGGAFFYEADGDMDDLGAYGEAWYRLQGPWRLGGRTELGDEADTLSVHGEYQF